MKTKETLHPRRARKTRGLSAALALCALLLSPTARAQRPPEPQTEKLLNGLRVLVAHRPGEAEVLLKLRVHSGAAFDLAGKEGTAALMGDSLFADGSARDFVVGELQGRLEVASGYDSVNVLMSGPVAEFERLAELLRNALMGAQTNAETFTRLRDARAKTLSELGIAPVAVADRAVAARLYGAHPYGRSAAGTPESLARIERGDLLFARERFLTPDNATLVVIGGVEPRRAMRALRQYLGGWRKSDQRVPATFRQPQTPDARTLVVERAGAPDAEIRLAVRGLARSDADAPAADVLAIIAHERWLAAAPELKGHATVVRHYAHALGGTFLMGASAPSTAAAAQSLDAARKVLRALASAPPSAEEFARARSAAAALLTKNSERPEWAADTWLDAQTYGLTATTAEWARVTNALTPSDVQRVAARLFANATPASVAVGDAARLGVDLAPLGGFEVLGAEGDARAARPDTNAPKQPVRLKRP